MEKRRIAITLVKPVNSSSKLPVIFFYPEAIVKFKLKVCLQIGQEKVVSISLEIFNAIKSC